MENYQGMVVVHGDLFEFDAAREFLIEYGNAGNKSRLKDLDQQEWSVLGLYEPLNKVLISTKKYDSEALDPALKGAKVVRFPRALIERGDELSEHVISDYNKQSLKLESGFHYVTPALSRRLNGELLEMKIDGITYIVDLEQMEIRQKDNEDLKFSFSLNAIDGPTEQFYNTKTKQPVVISQKITEYPEHVICFIFPPLSRLDPVGYCMLVDFPPTFMVCTHEWNPKHINIPWKDLDQTNVPELVRRNQIEQELQGGSKLVSNVRPRKEARVKQKKGI